MNKYKPNNIYNVDCYKAIKEIPDKSIDLVVTSPPYDDLRTYNGYSFDFENIAKELYRITKEGGVVVWIVNDATKNGSETGTSFKQALFFKKIGFNIHDTMIWNKGQCPFPDKTRYYQCFEYMFVFTKGKIKTFNPIEDKPNKCFGEMVHGTDRMKDGTTKVKSAIKLGNNRTIKEFGVRFNVWDISPATQNRTGHPATFPLQLAIDHIKSWSNEGDIVLDPFLGSGTTAIACVKTNRYYIGFEISEQYYKIAVNRLNGISQKDIKNKEKGIQNIFDILEEEE